MSHAGADFDLVGVVDSLALDLTNEMQGDMTSQGGAAGTTAALRSTLISVSYTHLTLPTILLV